MSLRYDSTNIVDRHTLHNSAPEGGERPFPEGSQEDIAGNLEWVITNQLFWATMTIGINTITEANAREFAERLAVYEGAFGAFLRKFDDDFNPVDRPITYADIHRRVGLTTNASTLTVTAFRKRVMTRLEEEAKRLVGRQMQVAAVA